MENYFTTIPERFSLNNNKIINLEKDFFELITNFVEPGNIIPNFWYNIITDKKGRSNLGTITMLSKKNSSDLISNKNINKNRSIKSNFTKNNLEGGREPEQVPNIPND